jgi:hypothetical protein
MIKTITVAICYDFDGTLSPTNRQENDFLLTLGIQPEEYWREYFRISRVHQVDPVLLYMNLMLDKTRDTEVKITKKLFADFGKNIKFFAGVEEWFDRINEYGWTNKIIVEHYVISSGIKEMIEGSVIHENFKEIYACSFIYDQHDIAIWPAMAVNDMTKAQFLFQISKGVTDISNHRRMNEFVPDEKRPVPFSRIIYVGEGITNIPCMKAVKDRGGHSIAVYAPRQIYRKEESESLVRDGRANFNASADYRKGKPLDKLIKSILEGIATKQNQ